VRRLVTKTKKTQEVGEWGNERQKLKKKLATEGKDIARRDGKIQGFGTEDRGLKKLILQRDARNGARGRSGKGGERF